MELPVGLLGEQIQIIFVLLSIKRFKMHEIQLKIVEQRRFAYFNIVYVGTYFIHAISGRTNNDIVFCRHTKTSVQEVYTFVAAIAKKDMLCINLLYFADSFFYLGVDRDRDSGCTIW